jgi:hypothetical protein
LFGIKNVIFANMNNKKAIFVISAAVIFYWLYQKFTFSQNLKIDIAKVSFGGSLTNPLIILKLVAINPSRVETTISNINGVLKLNDTIKIADITYQDKVLIKSYNKTDIDFNIYPNISGVIDTISQVLLSKKGNFTLTGSADIDGFTIPLNLNYNFK